MLVKNSPLTRKDTSIHDVLKYIKSSLLIQNSEINPEIKTLTTNSAECSLAIKVINQKLSTYIERLSLTSSQIPPVAMRHSSLQPFNKKERKNEHRKKLSTAYSHQIHYYEQELAKLVVYLHKITTNNYDGNLTNEIAQTKAKNVEIMKEIAEKKLKIDTHASKKQKEIQEARTDRNEDVFQLKYLERKIAKIDTKNQNKTTELEQFQEENKRLLDKIAILKETESTQLTNRDKKSDEKVIYVKLQIERVKKMIEQAESKAKKITIFSQNEIEKSLHINNFLKLNLSELSKQIEEQTNLIKNEEQKTGKSICDLKEFILRERTSTNDKNNIKKELNQVDLGNKMKVGNLIKMKGESVKKNQSLFVRNNRKTENAIRTGKIESRNNVVLH